MTSAKIKRSDYKTYINTTPSSSATYVLLGDGITSLKVNYNPKTTDETYIHQDTADISVDSYAPTMPVQMTAKNGDPAFEYLDGLRKSRAVLAACETDIVNVWAYETGGPSAYPAEKQSVSIQIDDFGGDGGKVNVMNFTINFKGTATTGTFNVTTPAFT
jgi:hypothetical protein